MSENFKHNDDSISPEQIIEAIEVCRPGSNDAADPSLAFIADHADFVDLRCRIEQIDAKIKTAFADVPVPAGLESRILAALTDAPAADQTLSTDQTTPLDASPKTSRLYRHWYLGVSAVFVAASLLVAMLLQWNAAPLPTESSVIRLAMNDFDSPLTGSPLDQQWPAAVKKFPPSLALNLANCKSIRWQKLDDFLDKNGVVYAFTTPQNAQARLYVLEAPAMLKNLPNSPQQDNPPGNTGGLLASAWQADGRLYILVVRGDKRAYRGLLIPAGPLT